MGYAEIGELEFLISTRQQNVVRLDVPVNESLGVNVLKGRSQLDELRENVVDVFLIYAFGNVRTRWDLLLSLFD